MQIKNLSFQHHAGAPFFQNLSFELEEGLIHALHGKNGVGKSVLLHLLSQQIDHHIEGGEAALMNQQFDLTLVQQFSFLENLQFSLLSRFPNPLKKIKAHAIPEQFIQLLKQFHIDVHIPVCQLSGGQRQILALLMKLQKAPRILLLDEPTATLDEQNAEMVFEFLSRLRGVTMLIVCHDQELIQRYTTGQELYLEIGSNGVRQLKELIKNFPQ
ncbi:MAG TPA: ATP-binding cassette domain-containing protein [Chlamydiales bacterium]|nr:ATP-binding cassette domain-containing protein [Chlamydiales bacterium]